MIPLTFADPGEENMIRKIGGNSETRQHLEDMGFVPGTSVTLISMLGGNVIVRVKESRVALDQSLAAKIMI